MKPSIFRPLQLAILAFIVVIVLGLLGSAWFTLREERRLADAEQQLGRATRFVRVQLLVAHSVEALSDGVESNDPTAETVGGQIDEMSQLCMHPETPAKLERFRGLLLQTIRTHGTPTPAVLILFQEVSFVEQTSEADLLLALHRQATSQLKLDVAVLLAVVGLGVLLVPTASRRIIRPLNAFGRQLSRLASGDFTPAPLDQVDPLLLPLHQQLNALTRRLADLEAMHAARERSLEAEVRNATHTLLEQQRSLARAERLAATGELAASVAHELRNPLAAIQMTLTNLRSELGDPALAERVDLVLGEVTRLSRLLNQLLDSARHAPEAPRQINLAQFVDETLTLTRYQVAPSVRIERRIDPRIICSLPQDRFRQALLNLILNSAAVLAKDGGRIEIAALREADRLRITVSDDGPGFPAAMLDSGIRPFMSTREHGTGLGLAMVRRFARDLGGEIGLSKQEPHGAVVTLILPADSAAS